jgi:glycosyltransferase involved in cell wall biosynthesis
VGARHRVATNLLSRIAFTSLLLADPALRQRMGQAGRVRARQEFTPEQMMNRVTAVYEAILNQQN